MPGRAAHGSALRLFAQLFFPPVLPVFSHHMHTAGIDPKPTPSLLCSPLWSMTHKAHLTFTRQNASHGLVEAVRMTCHLNPLIVLNSEIFLQI